MDELGLYSTPTIENTSEVSLSLGGLLLIALMAGGDYSEGLDGCGETTAHALAKCGFGDTLRAAVATLNEDSLLDFKLNWLGEVRRELQTNSQGFLPSRKPQLAASMSSSFLNHDILQFYVFPLTSFLPSQKAPDLPAWMPNEPNIVRLASFCTSHLGWQDGLDLQHVLHSNLWEGVFFRMLFSVRRHVLI